MHFTTTPGCSRKPCGTPQCLTPGNHWYALTLLSFHPQISPRPISVSSISASPLSLQYQHKDIHHDHQVIFRHKFIRHPESSPHYPCLSPLMSTIETARQIDIMAEHAYDRWFALGAYFFAFFSWSVMNNVDFTSEKWRACRRIRKLAHIHAASSILPIMYVAVYAEAQRRDGDNKELGAALEGLMFNLF